MFEPTGIKSTALAATSNLVQLAAVASFNRTGQLPEDNRSTDIAVSNGYARTVEQFPDEIEPAFAAAKKLSVEINRSADPAEEPTLIYVVANDDTVAP